MEILIIVKLNILSLNKNVFYVKNRDYFTKCVNLKIGELE
ncbi:hypothetical protein SAMN05660909_02490 [Chitinophaga terrae (ex Kim and Jung 2007)]|uniref:Uncharacterized protein n=1 Tax=Chitinophaga terrae (ex Kim and Jung 2007) TaxID=408074 RepID=A0A1H4C6E0_9BACT|nr:hypothetical protein SAMN05660909_02490 [Chitinophaga terrae (ex Kim and Jung 2007)]